MTDNAEFTHAGLEALIRRYFDGCNAADEQAIIDCFVPEAVHYFPPGMYGGAFRGAAEIAARWAAAVRDLGSIWTIEQVITDPDNARAVIEWTHYKTFSGTVLRGDEWYTFDRASGLIREIRAYYASPQAADLQRLELAMFDYSGRGYSLQPPDLPRPRPAAGEPAQFR
jgi:methyltransferase